VKQILVLQIIVIPLLSGEAFSDAKVHITTQLDVATGVRLKKDRADNTTAPVLASETAYITAFLHFPLSGPTLHSLHSAEPRQPCRALALSHALCTHLTLYSTLTLHTAAPSVHVLPHFLDISAFLCLSLAHWTVFLCIGPLSRASPGVPLAPPVHIVPSLPYFPAITLVPGLLSYAFSI
jgi:hypothetical protein